MGMEDLSIYAKKSSKLIKCTHELTLHTFKVK